MEKTTKSPPRPQIPITMAAVVSDTASVLWVATQLMKAMMYERYLMTREVLTMR